MMRTRLTRDQSREQTRQRLLDAGQATFVKKGIAAASVEDIAAAAGYTRGAFYSNFDSKTELLLELLKRDHEQRRAGLQTVFDLQVSQAELGMRIREYYSQMYRDNKCFLIWMEAKLKATRDAKFRVRFNALKQEALKDVTTFIEACVPRMGITLRMPAAALAVGLVSLCDGVQFMNSSDPQNVGSDLVETVLAEFFSAVAFDEPNRR